MNYTTTLTTSGNSVAVRLPKEILKASGLTHQIELHAKKGVITIKSKSNQRDGWAEQIKAEMERGGSNLHVDEYGDMRDELDSTTGDGIS